jgi:hypothetical protein
LLGKNSNNGYSSVSMLKYSLNASSLPTVMLGTPATSDLCDVFNMFLDGIPAKPCSIWFGDDTYLNLNGSMNKQNVCVWDSKHPYNIIAYYTQENAWCVLHTRGIVATIFFTILRLLIIISMLIRRIAYLFLFLQGLGINSGQTFFQKDGNWLHIVVLDVFSEHF